MSESHWDGVYRERGPEGVSWFQPVPKVSVDLVRRLHISTDSAVVDIGGGASGLAEALVADGFLDLCVLDISAVALEQLRQRISAGAGAQLVQFVQTNVLAWEPQRLFDLWHDRAVFHFLVEEHEREAYLDLLRRSLRVGGHLIMGTFASDGPAYCSGLPVVGYSVEALSNLLGRDFEMVEHTREEHVTPGGEIQPFTWVAARFDPRGSRER